jgi:hypothetical protein
MLIQFKHFQFLLPQNLCTADGLDACSGLTPALERLGHVPFSGRVEEGDIGAGGEVSVDVDGEGGKQKTVGILARLVFFFFFFFFFLESGV